MCTDMPSIFTNGFSFFGDCDHKEWEKMDVTQHWNNTDHVDCPTNG